MALPPVEFIPDAALERRALALLTEHEARTSKAVSLPVPVERIIERTLGLRVQWVELEEPKGEIILARVHPNVDGHPTVQMNERRQQHFESYFGTEAFSFGHEAGHWVLHYDRGRSTQSAFAGFFDEEEGCVLCRQLGDADRKEIQAERFAAFLLLPEHLLRPRLVGLDLTRRSVLSDLARDCGVSKTALRKRLQQLGLIVVGPDGAVAVPSRPLGALV